MIDTSQSSRWHKINTRAPPSASPPDNLHRPLENVSAQFTQQQLIGRSLGRAVHRLELLGHRLSARRVWPHSCTAGDGPSAVTWATLQWKNIRWQTSVKTLVEFIHSLSLYHVALPHNTKDLYASCVHWHVCHEPSISAVPKFHSAQLHWHQELKKWQSGICPYRAYRCSWISKGQPSMSRHVKGLY